VLIAVVCGTALQLRAAEVAAPAAAADAIAAAKTKKNLEEYRRSAEKQVKAVWNDWEGTFTSKVNLIKKTGTSLENAHVANVRTWDLAVPVAEKDQKKAEEYLSDLNKHAPSEFASRHAELNRNEKNNEKEFGVTQKNFASKYRTFIADGKKTLMNYKKKAAKQKREEAQAMSNLNKRGIKDAGKMMATNVKDNIKTIPQLEKTMSKLEKIEEDNEFVMDHSLHMNDGWEEGVEGLETSPHDADVDPGLGDVLEEAEENLEDFNKHAEDEIPEFEEHLNKDLLEPTRKYTEGALEHIQTESQHDVSDAVASNLHYATGIKTSLTDMKGAFKVGQMKKKQLATVSNVASTDVTSANLPIIEEIRDAQTSMESNLINVFDKGIAPTVTALQRNYLEQDEEQDVELHRTLKSQEEKTENEIERTAGSVERSLKNGVGKTENTWDVFDQRLESKQRSVGSLLKRTELAKNGSQKGIVDMMKGLSGMLAMGKKTAKFEKEVRDAGEKTTEGVDDQELDEVAALRDVEAESTKEGLQAGVAAEHGLTLMGGKLNDEVLGDSMKITNEVDITAKVGQNAANDIQKKLITAGSIIDDTRLRSLHGLQDSRSVANYANVSAAKVLEESKVFEANVFDMGASINKTTKSTFDELWKTKEPLFGQTEDLAADKIDKELKREIDSVTSMEGEVQKVGKQEKIWQIQHHQFAEDLRITMIRLQDKQRNYGTKWRHAISDEMKRYNEDGRELKKTLDKLAEEKELILTGSKADGNDFVAKIDEKMKHLIDNYHSKLGIIMEQIKMEDTKQEDYFNKDLRAAENTNGMAFNSLEGGVLKVKSKVAEYDNVLASLGPDFESSVDGAEKKVNALKDVYKKHAAVEPQIEAELYDFGKHEKEAIDKAAMASQADDTKVATKFGLQIQGVHDDATTWKDKMRAKHVDLKQRASKGIADLMRELRDEGRAMHTVQKGMDDKSGNMATAFQQQADNAKAMSESELRNVAEIGQNSRLEQMQESMGIKKEWSDLQHKSAMMDSSAASFEGTVNGALKKLARESAGGSEHLRVDEFKQSVLKSIGEANYEASRASEEIRGEAQRSDDTVQVMAKRVTEVGKETVILEPNINFKFRPVEDDIANDEQAMNTNIHALADLTKDVEKHIEERKKRAENLMEEVKDEVKDVNNALGARDLKTVIESLKKAYTEDNALFNDAWYEIGPQTQRWRDGVKMIIEGLGGTLDMEMINAMANRTLADELEQRKLREDGSLISGLSDAKAVQLRAELAKIERAERAELDALLARNDLTTKERVKLMRAVKEKFARESTSARRRAQGLKDRITVNQHEVDKVNSRLDGLMKLAMLAVKFPHKITTEMLYQLKKGMKDAHREIRELYIDRPASMMREGMSYMQRNVPASMMSELEKIESMTPEIAAIETKVSEAAHMLATHTGQIRAVHSKLSLIDQARQDEDVRLNAGLSKLLGMSRGDEVKKGFKIAEQGELNKMHAREAAEKAAKDKVDAGKEAAAELIKAGRSKTYD